MANKYLKNFFAIVLGWSLVIFQLGFINGLPHWLGEMNLIVVILIFILSIKGEKTVLWWSVLTGVLLDIFSFTPFGFNVINLSLIVIFSYFLLERFFTNRSLYSFLALILFASCCYRLLEAGVVYLIGFISSNELIFYLDKDFWFRQAGGVGVDLIITVIIFYLLSLFSHALKPMFLLKRNR